ncbi:MAG: hypothetical protein NE334_00310 [Lentisphaeraceae bacterium]|nr:hypothetical protein [Lentisphaeraceae bacterium]
MSLIVPCLGRNNWKGKDLLLHRDLLMTNHLHRAVVCYGMKGENGKYQYLTSLEAEQSGYTVELVESEAMNNMLYLEQQEESDWVPIITESQGQNVTILTKTGSDLTAGNILRSDILKDLQHYFESPTVAIGIPNRNTIIACAKPMLMLEFLKRKFQESVSRGFEPLSDMLYLAKGGLLIGASPYPGTEDLVDRSMEDTQTVSLNKASADIPRKKTSKGPKTLINFDKKKKASIRIR